MPYAIGKNILKPQEKEQKNAIGDWFGVLSPNSLPKGSSDGYMTVNIPSKDPLGKFQTLAQ